jgi:tRNA 2-thiouridine synthesizing protein B
MSMLHTVNKSPFGNGALSSCLRHVNKGDAVLLLEDGVYGALKGTIASGDIWARRVDVRFYVIAADVAARGLAKNQLIEGLNLIDYAGFVDLVTQHKSSQAWL